MGSLRNSSFATTRAKTWEALQTSSSASLPIIIAGKVQGVTKDIWLKKRTPEPQPKPVKSQVQMYGL